MAGPGLSSGLVARRESVAVQESNINQATYNDVVFANSKEKVARNTKDVGITYPSPLRLRKQWWMDTSCCLTGVRPAVAVFAGRRFKLSR